MFFLYSAATQHLGNYIESRRGIQLQDKLLYILPSIDFSEYIFLTLYVSLGLVVLLHLNRPKVILRIIEMHFAVAVLRQLCILLVALEPPVGIIVLRDVFLENTVYPHHSPMTKDLFFSGHVASIWLYFLCAEVKWLKRFLLVATGLMAFMILSMKVHYTYDVYGALVFTTILFYVPLWIRSFVLNKQAVEVESE
ncbi:MAG: hypothetical protein JNM95_08070 [Chitinophagaceae bacterium]|nr:hypothetical protein [Chitinophagaceae bacterium]